MCIDELVTKMLNFRRIRHLAQSLQIYESPIEADSIIISSVGSFKISPLNFQEGIKETTEVFIARRTSAVIPV